jgi:hypothetical protein
MPRYTTFSPIAVAVLLAATALSADAAPLQDRGRNRGGSGVQSIDTTFRMDKGALIDLEATFGNIIVTGASGNEVRIRATADGGRVRLRATSTLATLRSSAERSGTVRYEVSVPAGVRVLMSVTSGDLTATGVKGDVEMESINGRIQVTDITGLTNIETVSSDIVATRLSGGAQIETTSGSVTLTGGEGEISVENTSGLTTLNDIRSSVVSAESMSGDVRFQGTIQPSGRYEFSSHSGNIRMTLPANAGALLTLSTYSGSINSEFPITLQQGLSAGDQKEMQFRLGSGSARVTAESFSGNIIITRGAGRERQE